MSPLSVQGMPVSMPWGRWFELLDRDLTSGGVSDAARRVEVVSAPGISALQLQLHDLVQCWGMISAQFRFLTC